MIIESVIDFLKKCPYVNGPISADFLGAKPENYAVEATPSASVIKTYADGGSLRQFTFVFASRCYMAEEINVSNHNFFENLTKWFEKCTNEKNLPEIGEKMTCQSIETLNGGCMYEMGANTARYQVQCKLIYYKEA